MLVRPEKEGVVVDEIDTFTDLHVELGGLPEQQAAAALAAAGSGELAREHAWLEIDWLRASGPDRDDWRTGFDAMIDYARRKGWVDESGRRVRAHVAKDDGGADADRL